MLTPLATNQNAADKDTLVCYEPAASLPLRDLALQDRPEAGHGAEERDHLFGKRHPWPNVIVRRERNFSLHLLPPKQLNRRPPAHMRLQ